MAQSYYTLKILTISVVNSTALIEVEVQEQGTLDKGYGQLVLRGKQAVSLLRHMIRDADRQALAEREQRALFDL